MPTGNCFLLIFTLLSIGLAGEQIDLRTTSWAATTTNTSSLNANVSAADVMELLNSVSQIDIKGTKLGVWADYKVSAFRFVDMDGDGVLELATELKGSAVEGGAPMVMIVHDGSQFGYVKLNGHEPYGGSLNTSIQDLDGDGVYEVIMVEWPLSIQPGAYWSPLEWPTIYSYLQKRFTRQEGRFRDFYLELIRTCNGKIEKIESETPDLRGVQLLKRTLHWEYEIDRARRLLGIDVQAGLQAARALSTDDEEYAREVAILIAGEIGNSAGAEVLLRLTEDRSPFIRMYAATSLFHIGGSQFIQTYIKLLSDKYFDSSSNAYPVREAAASLLMSLGVRIEKKGYDYIIKKQLRSAGPDGHPKSPTGS